MYADCKKKEKSAVWLKQPIGAYLNVREAKRLHGKDRIVIEFAFTALIVTGNDRC